MEIKGKVVKVLDFQSGTSSAGKDWKKRDIVIETEEQYPKKVSITFFGDKAESLSQFDINDTVRIDFSVESREWQGKWFTNVNGLRIDLSMDRQIGETTASGTPISTFEPTQGDDDGLPF